MSDCCSSSTSICCSSSSSSADVTVTEFETQIVNPNNPEIVVTTTTSTSCDKCCVKSGNCPHSCSSSSSSSCSSRSKCSSSSPKCPSTSSKCRHSGIKCFKFQATFGNVINLLPNPVEFVMRRSNNTVTLQWTQFSGIINANGIPFIAINQNILSIPPYPIDKTIGMLYNGVGRVGIVEVTFDSNQVRFYFTVDKSGATVQSGDSFTIYGGSTTWIVG